MAYRKTLLQDKKLSPILGDTVHQLELRKNISLQLMSSIMSQQLSTKVARVIYERFLGLYGGKQPKPQQVLDTAPEKLRSIGLSNAKVSYVLNVANFCIAHKITDAKLQKMDNEAIIELLTQIKGVGQWTVEMLLMFSLGREDVFAVDDLGIQQAMCKIYRIDHSNKRAMKQKMVQISAKWRPYRTYACLHLWSWKDVGA